MVLQNSSTLKNQKPMILMEFIKNIVTMCFHIPKSAIIREKSKKWFWLFSTLSTTVQRLRACVPLGGVPICDREKYNILPQKTIKCHKRPYKTTPGHSKSEMDTHGYDSEKLQKYHKARKGHTRPHKANKSITTMYHRR